MSFIRKIKVKGKTYLSEVENIREGNKVKQKFIRYIGREVAGKRIYSGTTENVEVTKVKIWAPLLVLNTLAKQIYLSEILGDYGEYLLSLAYAHCLEPKSLNSMEEWFQRTDLHNLLSIQEVSEKKLYYALDSIDDKNSALVQKKIFNSVKNIYNLKPDGYFFDVTNAYFYGTECSIAKKGYNKDGKDNPQVQIGLAVTKEEGIPIFHKTFEGNIFDARILKDFLEGLKDLNVKNVTLIWDRGCTSEDNLLDAKKAGFEVICGLAMKQDVERKTEEILKKKEDFFQLKNRVRLKNTIFYCVKEKYSYGKIKGHFVLCFNEEKARATKERRIDEVYKAQEKLSEGKEISEGLKKYFDEKNNIDEREILNSQKYDGYSIIFSTQELPINQIVKPYFEKDKVEKAFRSMKSILGLRPIKHWLEERVKSHIFICYLSYLLISLLDYKIKQTKISAIEALDKLSTAYKVYLKSKKLNKEFSKTVTLTKEQEKIMKAIDKKILSQH